MRINTHLKKSCLSDTIVFNSTQILFSSQSLSLSHSILILPSPPFSRSYLYSLLFVLHALLDIRNMQVYVYILLKYFCTYQYLFKKKKKLSNRRYNFNITQILFSCTILLTIPFPLFTFAFHIHLQPDCGYAFVACIFCFGVGHTYVLHSTLSFFIFICGKNLLSFSSVYGF